MSITKLVKRVLAYGGLILMTALVSPTMADSDEYSGVRYGYVKIDGINIFYREAGPVDAPSILLLHGYPSSSRMFEPLFPLLSKKYHLIAPDYPGFGHSDAPSNKIFNYTFDHLAKVIDSFTKTLELKNYVLYMQDYGGPIGFRLAVAHPERIRALVIQNTVIHEVGLSDVWKLRRSYWSDRNANEPKIRDGMYSVNAGIARHVGGRPHQERYNPDLWMDEIAFLRSPGEEAIQLDLAYDYQSNVASYPTWQAYLRDHHPPVLVVWGKHDPIFTLAGAEAFKNESPNAEIHIVDAGHFAIFDDAAEIAMFTQEFLAMHLAESLSTRTL